jgi:O-antigen ligase
MLSLLFALAWRYRSPLNFAFATLLLLVAVVDLPRAAHVGPLTAAAVLTIAIAAIVMLALLTQHCYFVSAFEPLLFFSCLSLTSIGVTKAGVQNITALAILSLAVSLGGVVRGTKSLPDTRIARMISAALFTPCAAYLSASVILGPGANVPFAARAVALLAVVCTAWGAALSIGGKRHGKYLKLAGFATTILSLSRLAVAAAAAILLLEFLFRRRRQHRVLHLIVVASVLSGMAYVALRVSNPFSERFQTGDVVNVMGLHLNVNGRGRIWAYVWHSASHDWLGGHGAGSADNLTTSHFGTAVAHPHNDFLRLLNDYGAIGLALWLGWLAVTIARLRLSRKNTRDTADRIFASAATLALVGMLAGMATDNVLDYPYVVASVGLLCGLGAAHNSGRAMNRT